jgi:carboxyl-terminal processing protease
MTLTVVHPGEVTPVKIVIIRALIEFSSVSWTMIPGTEIGWIRLDSFTRGAGNDIRSAANRLRTAGATSIILDLRSNPGGLLTEALRISGHFLGNSTVLQQEDRFGTRTPVRTEMPGVAKDFSLVVLVNRQSASASEVLAGAIQDNQRGEIIGEATAGTGTVLSLFELEDNSAILLGTTRWLTPDGRSVRRVGITPDLEVANKADDSWLTPDEIASSTWSDLLTGKDVQLATAIRHLFVTTNKLPELDRFDIPAPPHFDYR